MVKDDPNPVIFKLRCTGVFPKVGLNTKEVKFDRLLLGQKAQQVLEIKNKCKIKIRWKLMGLEEFPEEFTFTLLESRNEGLEGELDPTETALIEIEFTAIT